MTPINTYSWFDKSLDFLVIVVISVSVLSLILLVFDIFDPKIAICSGLALALASKLKGFSHSLVQSAGVGLIPIAIVVLMALIFRTEPYPWISGGQDQGVYVSMSAHYQNGGKIFIKDSILPEIDDPGLIESYKNSLERKKYQPGVYHGGQEDYVFSFYHLHPLWMAIFGNVLGDEKRTYALTFFSLVGIIFLVLLTYELSSSRLAAISVGMLLAVNPLHAFFSKCPTTEIVALAFSAISFYYLARAYRGVAHGVPHRVALFLSALALAMFFFTRISGFFYLPVLTILFMAGIWLRETKQQQFGKDLVVYVLFCIALYVLSVFYGLTYSPNYSMGIYKITFGMLAGVSWQWVLSGLFFCMFAAMIVWAKLIPRPNFAISISRWLSVRHIKQVMVCVLLLALAASLFQVYQIGFTNAFADHSWYGQRWKLSGSAMEVVYRATVINWLIYTSPLLVVFGVTSLFRKEVGWPVIFLLIVPATVLIIFSLRFPVLPYQYYYARYLLTEAVPYILVTACVTIFTGALPPWRRAVGVSFVFLSVFWFSFFTIKQFGAEEGVRPYQVLDKVAKYIDAKDVLLIEPSNWRYPRTIIETPLRFYFGLNTFVIPESEREIHLNNISSSFSRVWLLAPSPVFDERFKLHSRLFHEDLVMERAGHIPLKLVYDSEMQLYLYILKKKGWPEANNFLFENTEYNVGLDNQIAAFLGKGWHTLERQHIWSSQQAELVLKAFQFKDEKLPNAIILKTSSAFGSSLRVIDLDVDACGVQQTYKYSSNNRKDIKIRLPYKRESLKECKINFIINDANSPKALGLSQDSRILGISVYSFAFE